MKRIDQDGSVILDFQTMLVILSPEMAREICATERSVLTDWASDFTKPDLRGYGQPPGGYSCAVQPFQTAKGRTAIRVTPGTTHRAKFYRGSGSRNWNGWERRKPVGRGVYALAAATSNGGGCWYETVIVPIDRTYSAEQAEYAEGIGS